MRALLALALGSLLALGSQAQSGPANTAPGRTIAGQYIVVFHPQVNQPAALANELARQNGALVLHTYTSAIKGFAARMSDTAVQALSRNPNVAYIEPDATVTANETAKMVTQSNEPWGLDRIDQRALPLNSTYRYEYTASGVYAFIIDTGILSTHQDFSGRVLPGLGYGAISDGYGTSDCNGHGTHVAGTVGGATYGVAKGVTLVPVRVLDCNGSGSNSGVIAGINYVAGSTNLRPAVANMSLGGGYSAALNSAVAGAVGAGVTMVVAAGNSSADACNSSPSSEPSAITVGATTNTDARASYSNYGTCLDVFAPGTNITSAWNTSNTATNTISGTSMASPHVTGVAALLVAGGATTPAAVTTALLGQSTPGVVTSAGSGSPNRLLFSVASEANVTLQTVTVSNVSTKGVKSNGKNWVATATVTASTYSGSNYGAGVSGVTVSGTFSGGGGNASCVTGTGGTCTLSSGNLNTGTASSTLTISNLSGAGYVYDSNKNIAQSWVVNKP